MTSDIVALLERATAAGGRIATPIQEQREHRVKVAFVQDIEGHLIEVVELTSR